MVMSRDVSPQMKKDMRAMIKKVVVDMTVVVIINFEGEMVKRFKESCSFSVEIFIAVVDLEKD